MQIDAQRQAKVQFQYLLKDNYMKIAVQKATILAQHKYPQ